MTALVIDGLIRGTGREVAMLLAELDTAVVDLVDERSGPACERCGRYVDGQWFSRQHRIARGSGGSRRLAVHSVANRVKVCGSATSPDGCHAWMEDRSNLAQAQFEGYVISQHGDIDPLTVPILLSSGFAPGSRRWVYLLNDGTTVALTDREVEAHERNRP